MSRTPAKYNLRVVRNGTWSDFFDYVDNTGAPVDLTGYQARLQVRTEQGAFGLSTTDTLLLELSTANGKLAIVTPPNGTVPNRVNIPDLTPADFATLNPNNDERVDYPYGLELFKPAGVDPLYVIPLVHGRCRVDGWEVR